MTVTELLMVALAVWQAVEIWHHGELFHELRSWLEVVADQPRSRLIERLLGFGSDLLLCPFCLSVWTGWLCVLLWQSHWWLCHWLLYGLAVSRLANLASDASAGVSRTPGRR